MKPVLGWLLRTWDTSLHRRARVELTLIKEVEKAQAELAAFRKESIAEAKKSCTAKQIRAAKMGNS